MKPSNSYYFILFLSYNQIQVSNCLSKEVMILLYFKMENVKKVCLRFFIIVPSVLSKIQFDIYPLCNRLYRVRHKFSNQLKCQYLKKYLTYWDKLFFINSTNSLQSFWHQNGVHGHNDGHFIGILVTPSTFFWHTQKKSSRRL